ncbi:MAG: hypothetical protein ACM31C_21205 [Acidobacteriota bacterium]
MQQLARATFMSKNLRVPTNWQDPSGDPEAKHYGQAFKDSEKASSPGAPPLFTPASLNKYHTDTQKMLISKYGEFIDGICSAICSAWSQWQSTATMAGFVVTGPMVVGGIIPPVPWMPLIMASAPKGTPMMLKYSTTVANVISMQWLALSATITVSAPFAAYPPFATFPSPAIPPPGIPNMVPIPLAALPTIMDMLVSNNTMKPMMVGMLGDPQAPFHQELFESICTAFEQSFTIWKSSTMLNQVMAMGAVPTWTPVSPAGPVVGTAMMLPGGMT